MPAKGTIEFADLQQHFHLPMAEVAKRFNVCTTFFKKVCRQHGIKRWPFRKLKSLQKKIGHLKTLPGQASYADDSKVNHLQARLEELRKMQPQCFTPAAEEDEEEEEASSHNEGSQSDASPMELETAEGHRDAEAHACSVLAGLRHGPSWLRTLWSPVELPPVSELTFEVGQKERPRERSSSQEPTLRSRSSSFSSGATIDILDSPMATRVKGSEDISALGGAAPSMCL